MFEIYWFGVMVAFIVNLCAKTPKDGFDVLALICASLFSWAEFVAIFIMILMRKYGDAR